MSASRDAARPVVWLLNFDADRELASPGYTPSRAVARRLATLPDELSMLVRPTDVVLTEAHAVGSVRGVPGLAWCPTPRALERLVRAGALPPRSPSREVLARVNARRFSAELGASLPGAQLVDAASALVAAVAAPPPDGLAARWCLKSAWSASGSGRRLVEPGPLSDADLAWAARHLAYGLQVEPWVTRAADFAQHGHLARDGSLCLGEPTRQRIDELGRWCGSALADHDDLAPSERHALRHEAERVAEQLAKAGYFGPFNVDAYRYVTRAGVAFEPRCEINARYTMGWAVGMHGRRPDLDEVEGARE